MAKDFTEIEKLVRNDIRRGLAGDNVGPDGKPAGDRIPDAAFTPLKVAGARSRDGVLYTNAITGDGGSTAVEWAFQCRHTGHFGGIFPTNRVLTIHGVTIVRRRGGKTQFRRYVDWSTVMSELGVSASFRPTVDTLADIPGFDTTEIRVVRPDRPPVRGPDT